MNDKLILLSHGSGGAPARELVHELMLKHLGNALLDPLEDAAICGTLKGKVALTCDSYVVSPLFFPGGDIGKLAVCGTVNDLAVMGAQPLYLTLALIIEEGFPMTDLERVVRSAAAASREAGVSVVAGDTKVVEKGSADGVFVTTSGIGTIPARRHVSASAARAGDRVIVSGTIGDHGITVLSAREELGFSSGLESDCAPLNGLVEAMFAAVSGTRTDAAIRCLRDPTRGGLGASVVELASSSGVEVTLREASIPLRDEVRGTCEMLGFDPLYVANEGKLVAIVGPGSSDAVLAAMKEHPLGRDAALIGEVTGEKSGRVLLSTEVGGTRVVTLPAGEQLPRIC